MKKKRNLLSRFIQVLSGSPEKIGSLSPEGQYPFITEDMISQVDGPIKTSHAIKAYKKHMLAIGYLEKTELSDFVRTFQEDLQEHEQHLKDELAWAKETFAEVKAEAKSDTRRVKKLLSKCEDEDEDEKKDFARELGATEKEVASAAGDLEKSSKELMQFKKDKRTFLVNYINTEVHGHDWKELIILSPKSSN